MRSVSGVVPGCFSNSVDCIQFLLHKGGRGGGGGVGRVGFLKK